MKRTLAEIKADLRQALEYARMDAQLTGYTPTTLIQLYIEERCSMSEKEKEDTK